MEKILKTPDAISGYLFCDPERNGEFRFLKKALRKFPVSPVVFDIGANVGQYASKVKSYKPDARIYCFEPAPKSFELLSQRFSGDITVTLGNSALSASTGMANLYVYGDLNQMNSLERHTEDNKIPVKIHPVTITTVDEYCLQNCINRIHYMKIDVEGHEVQVLQGAKKMLNEGCVNIVQFEYNFLWKKTSNTLKDALQLLRKFRVYRLTPWGKIHVHAYTTGLEKFPAASNYLAIYSPNLSFLFREKV